MRTRASVPVAAPGPQQWQAWWTPLVARLTQEGAEADAGGDQPWRPGARWDLTPAGLTRGSLEATVRSAGRGRAVVLAYREHAEPGRQARVDVDGLEQPRTATTQGALAPVAWTGTASMAAAGPVLRLDLTLPWGRLRLRARVVADRLESELVVRGRGLWRPLVAVGLRLVREQVRVGLQRATERAAVALGRVAADPRAAAAGGPDGIDIVLGEVLDDGPGGGSVDGPDHRSGGGPRAAGTARPLDRALDLGWLRSPVTVLSHLRRGYRDSR